MEQVSFQQQQFQGIVPVLDVGDPSASLVEAQSNLVSDQQARLGQLQRDATVQMQNAEQYANDLKQLGELSQKAAKTFKEVSNSQTKKKAAEVWAEAYNNYEAPEQIALGKEYADAEKEQSSLETKVNTTVSGNVQKIKEPTAEDSARAGRVRETTGIYSTVAANARAYAAMDSYGPAYQSYLTRVNQQRVANGLQPLQPGSAEMRTMRDEFNSKWADQTGMSMANPGFSARYVYPTLRKEMGRRNEQYTKIWNVGHADRTTEKTLFELGQGKINLQQFWEIQRGLTRGDGVSLKTNEDIWGTLARAQLTTTQLTNMKGGVNPSTGQSLKDHPRFQSLMTDARKRDLDLYNVGRNTAQMTLQQDLAALGPNPTKQQLEAFEEQALNDPRYIMYPGIVSSQVNSARSRSAEAERIQDLSDELDREVALLPEGGKLPPGRLDGMPIEIKQRYSGFMSPSDQSDSMIGQLKETDTFKSIEKDFKGSVQSLGDLNIKFGGIMGGKDPANFNLYKQDALNSIALRAQTKMLGTEGMSQDQALREAFAEWRDEQKALAQKGELFDINKNEFKPSALTGNQAANEQARLQIDRLNNTEFNDLSAGLVESDWTMPPKNGQYSERVKYLGRRFSLTPEEVVNLTRQQKGLPPNSPSPSQAQLNLISPAERARITALDKNAPISLALRAQINSGQNVSGNAKQRTIAIGQHLNHLGYGGIWQHKDFNYDSGYTGTGKEEMGSHAGNSYHNYGEALDIGVQANGPQKLETLYQYLLKNKSRFGIAELFYDPDGSRGHPSGHTHHVHVSFAGGDSGTMQQ